MDIAGINKRDWSCVKTCSDKCASLSRSKGAKTKQAKMSKEEIADQGRKGGLASAAKRVIRSKDEIKLYEMVLDSFPSALHNFVIVDGWDADIVIPEAKLAIMWNGPWHYKDMPHRNHSLSQVQTRDRHKIKRFETLGWTVKVYEDRSYTPESAFIDIKDYLHQSLVQPQGIEP